MCCPVFYCWITNCLQTQWLKTITDIYFVHNLHFGRAQREQLVLLHTPHPGCFEGLGWSRLNVPSLMCCGQGTETQRGLVRPRHLHVTFHVAGGFPEAWRLGSQGEDPNNEGEEAIIFCRSFPELPRQIPGTGCLKMKMYSFIVLEAPGPKSGCQQGHGPSKALWSLGALQLLVCWQVLASLDLQTHYSSLCLHLPSVSVSLHLFSHSDLGPTPPPRSPHSLRHYYN